MELTYILLNNLIFYVQLFTFNSMYGRLLGYFQKNNTENQYRNRNFSIKIKRSFSIEKLHRGRYLPIFCPCL